HRDARRRGVRHVADHADDLGARIRTVKAAAATEPYPLADLILAGPEAMRGGFIDDRHARPTGTIRRRERAPPDNGHAECAKMVRPHVVAEHLGSEPGRG